MLQAEILVRRLGNIADFDNDSWEYKMIKLFKALTVMERHKLNEPLFSKSFSELANYLIEKRKLDGSQLMKSCQKSEFSLQDFSNLQAIDSIYLPKGLNDSILTGKDGPSNFHRATTTAPPSQLQVRANGQNGQSALDYDDPLYTESACQNYTSKVSTSPLEMPDHVQNSKPLLVSELVNNYKGMSTSTMSEPSIAVGESKISKEPSSSRVIADYANENMPNAAKKGTTSTVAAKNYTIIEESADENDQD